MKIVHTMIRVNDLDESLKFYCDGLGMKLLKKREYESGRFTNVFVGPFTVNASSAISRQRKGDSGSGIAATSTRHRDVACPGRDVSVRGHDAIGDTDALPPSHGAGSCAPKTSGARRIASPCAAARTP